MPSPSARAYPRSTSRRRIRWTVDFGRPARPAMSPRRLRAPSSASSTLSVFSVASILTPPSCRRRRPAALPVANGASEARYAIASAISSAVPSRPSGWRATRPSRDSPSSSTTRSIHGVSIVPGQTQFTRMPSLAWSIASARVKAITAPFEAP